MDGVELHGQQRTVPGKAGVREKGPSGKAENIYYTSVIFPEIRKQFLQVLQIL